MASPPELLLSSAAILVDCERQSEKLGQELQSFETLCQLSLLHLSFIAPDVSDV